MAELTEHAHAELVVLYQIGVDDIEKAKQWAWNVTYQTVLAQGGVLALYTAYVAPVPSFWVRLVFVILSLAVTVVAHRAISDSVESLQTFRLRVGRCRAALTESSQTLMGPPTEKRTWPLRCLIWVTFVLIAGLLVLYRSGSGSGPV
jgi:hypothetical protein